MLGPAGARPGGRPRRQRPRHQAAFGTRGRTLGLAACVALALCGCCCLYYATSPAAGAPSFSLLPTASAAAAVQQQEEQQQVPVFVATKEWQVIPEGAAIPPGLHIRLDMSTGERMGKLMDEAEAQQQSAGGGANGTGEGNIVILDAKEEQDGQEPGAKKMRVRQQDPERLEGEVTAHDPTVSPQEAMEKVLLNLPQPEKDEMGIDALHQTKGSLSEEAYWARIEELWAERQALLQRAYDNMLKPAEALGKLISTITNATATLSSSSDDNNHQQEVVTSSASLDDQPALRQALIDLEDFLTDIDMARDFYTLGGWGPLVRLLEPGHASETRWRAAWALGNAVKNDAESQLWLLEAVPHAASSSSASALSRLVSILEAGHAASASPGEEEGWARHDEELLRKAVYALTSAARNNGRVQAHLREAGGLEVMGRLLHHNDKASAVEREQRRPLRVKLASFGHDLAVEANDLLQGYPQAAGAQQEGAAEAGRLVLASVTSREWCMGTLSLLEEVASVAGNAVETEKVLHALGALHGACHDESHLPPQHVAATLKSTHATVASSAFSAGMDADYHEELLSAIQALAHRVENALNQKDEF